MGIGGRETSFDMEASAKLSLIKYFEGFLSHNMAR
jgi:hypothetical protein